MLTQSCQRYRAVSAIYRRKLNRGRWKTKREKKTFFFNGEINSIDSVTYNKVGEWLGWIRAVFKKRWKTWRRRKLERWIASKLGLEGREGNNKKSNRLPVSQTHTHTQAISWLLSFQRCLNTTTTTDNKKILCNKKERERDREESRTKEINERIMASREPTIEKRKQLVKRMPALDLAIESPPTEMEWHLVCLETDYSAWEIGELLSRSFRKVLHALRCYRELAVLSDTESVSSSVIQLTPDKLIGVFVDLKKRLDASQL